MRYVHGRDRLVNDRRSDINKYDIQRYAFRTFKEIESLNSYNVSKIER